MDDATVTAAIDVDAAPETVYRLITDLPTFAALTEETVAMRWRRGSAAEPGAVFRGSMRNGWYRWSTTCEVTEASPGRAFAFDVRHTVVPVSHWRYDIDALPGGGCRVTERTWDRRPGWFKPVALLGSGVHDRAAANERHMRATLGRVKARAEAG